MAKKKKLRVELRKNRNDRPREQGWTRDFQQDQTHLEDAAHSERVRAKGEHSRHRTIIADDQSDGREIDPALCRPGRVLRVHRDVCIVQADDDGRELRCAVRWLLRSLSIESRTIVTTGDRVWFSIPPVPTAGIEGVIERVEPRHGILTRASRGREHVIVANVDQVVIVVSLVEPELKVHLIDRFLASAMQGQIKPVLCLNKADRVNEADYQGLLGTYNQLGIATLLTSARTGKGVDRLRELLRDKQTVFSGQSGVGKSSLLNAIQPELGLRVREVSEVNSKGRHTTTHADLIRLQFGGWVVDTPGVRQFTLWAVAPGEVEGYFPEFRPLVPWCGFRDCTHTHEERCAVKRAVHRREISALRYTSYVGLYREMSEGRRPTSRPHGG